jgi:spermidine/putrescine transport system substrate-binding protein
MMTKGEIWLSYAWSGDAVWAIEEAATVDVELDYIVPNEGSNIWFDGWVIPKYDVTLRLPAILRTICVCLR